MNTDIRVDVGFLDHWKTDAVITECGAEGVLALIRLWIFAAQNKPDGRLDGIKTEMLERVAKWKGETGKLLKCLVETRFIEQDEQGIWLLHDWERHNPYAASAEWRHERAKKANAARRAKPEGRQGKDTSATSALLARYKRAPVPVPVPVPVPSPDPDPPYPVVEVLSNEVRLVQVGATHEQNSSTPCTPGTPGAHEPNQTNHLINDETIKIIIEMYHELLPMCPHVKAITHTLKRQITERLVEDLPVNAEGFPPFYLWRLFFMDIATRSPLLTGQLLPAEGFHKTFKATLEWLTQTKNYQAIEAGKYFDSPRSHHPSKGNGEDRHVHQQH